MDQTERVITIATVFLDEKISGTPRRILRICKYLDRSRFRPVVVIPKGDGEFAQLLREIDVTVHEVSNLKRPRYSLDPRLFLEWIWNLPTNLKDVQQILQDEKVDIVHAYGLTQITGPLSAHACGTRLVWHINDDATPKPLAHLLIRLIKKPQDRIVLTSKALGEHYFGAQHSWQEKMDILYSTVDLHDFYPKKDRNLIRQELGVDDNEILVGMLANFNPMKGHIVFLEAAALLSQDFSKLKFLIGGRKLDLRRSYYNKVKERIDRLGLANKVIMVGYRQDVPDVLNALDVLVVPSTWEPLGVIVMEGMAASKPIVATDAGGIPEMIDNGVHGLLFPSEDRDKLVASVSRTLTDPALAQRLSSNAHERVWKEFSPERAAAAYEHVYSSILKDHRSEFVN